jgi:hypothetical protein
MGHDNMADAELGKKLQILGFFLFLAPFFAVPISMITMSSGGSAMIMIVPCSFIFAVIGFALIFVGQIISHGGSIFGHRQYRQRIPPVRYPQQHHHEREKLDVKEISCPDCGASPKYIDMYGICHCEYCGTKFKVR